MKDVLMYKLFSFHVMYELSHFIKIDKVHLLVNLTSNYLELVLKLSKDQVMDHLNISLKKLLCLSLKI